MWPGLQVILHALPSPIQDNGERHELTLPDPPFKGESLTVLDMKGLAADPLPIPFDQVISRMEQSGTIYSEGDGSFAFCGNQRCSSDNQQIVWFGRNGQLVSLQDNPDWFTDPEQRSTWKIEGNLFDGTDSLHHCTLTGFAPVSQWEDLLQLIMGDDADRAIFQMQQLGIHCLADDLLDLFR